MVKNLLRHTEPPCDYQGGPALLLNQVTDSGIMQREHVSYFRDRIELRLQLCPGFRAVHFPVFVLMLVPLLKAVPDNAQLMVDRNCLKMMLVEQVIALRFLQSQHSAHRLYCHSGSFIRSHCLPSLLVC